MERALETIAMTTAAAERRVPPVGAERPLRRVLVVDDIPEIGQLYKAIFRRIKAVDVRGVFEVRGDRAIERLRREAFDLVITDMRLPGASGSQVIAAARRSDPSTRIVVMSGNVASISADAVKDEVVAVVAKPIDANRVIELLGRLLAPS